MKDVTDEEIMGIAEKYMCEIGGYDFYAMGIPDNGAIEGFARAIIKYVEEGIK